jgi:hypothetical protein
MRHQFVEPTAGFAWKGQDGFLFWCKVYISASPCPARLAYCHYSPPRLYFPLAIHKPREIISPFQKDRAPDSHSSPIQHGHGRSGDSHYRVLCHPGTQVPSPNVMRCN